LQPCPHWTLHEPPAVHWALQLSRHAMLQLATLEHVAVQPGLAPQLMSQLAPPLQLHDEPAQAQLVPAHVGTA